MTARVGVDDFNEVPEPNGESTHFVRTYNELYDDYITERQNPEWQPVHLGFGTIDARIRGVSPGQLLGIAARTSVGKTWMLQTIEHNFSIRDDAGCMSFTLEMPGGEWFERAYAIHERIAPSFVETLAKDAAMDPSRFLERMRHSRVVERAVTLDKLEAIVLEGRASLEVPLRLLLIDYLGMIHVQGSRDSYERVSRIGRELKQLAKSQKLAVVVAMQVSRAGGDGSVPVELEMLRDSGVLEESVDFLIGAWRPERANNLTEIERAAVQDLLRVRILKSRKGGEGGIIDLRFNTDSRCLYEPAAL